MKAFERALDEKKQKRTEVVCVRIASSDLALVDDLCDRYGVSRNSVFRQMVKGILSDADELEFDVLELG